MRRILLYLLIFTSIILTFTNCDYAVAGDITSKPKVFIVTQQWKADIIVSTVGYSYQADIIVSSKSWDTTADWILVDKQYQADHTMYITGKKWEAEKLIYLK
ncbi:DUF6150 family protein [Flammeovirga pacifica]|uniref:7(1) septoil knot domain-containing protein n=1 Tax=Flammeovirga pacifica TaxID=915059 RepID=A0A1S1YT64_FLAPC|nr:DUF6150 family protein [Flammeovirga pacifica]OHX64221.1 hypothetical protein NH26_21700 [Flammeovirga pacifica]